MYTTKSALIALALVRQRLTVEQAAQAAHVEVNSQIERWGEVEDCECCAVDGKQVLTLSSAHDVDFHDMRRQLGSVATVLVDS